MEREKEKGQKNSSTEGDTLRFLNKNVMVHKVTDCYSSLQINFSIIFDILAQFSYLKMTYISQRHHNL